MEYNQWTIRAPHSSLGRMTWRQLDLSTLVDGVTRQCRSCIMVSNAHGIPVPLSTVFIESVYDMPELDMICRDFHPFVNVRHDDEEVIVTFSAWKQYRVDDQNRLYLAITPNPMVSITLKRTSSVLFRCLVSDITIHPTCFVDIQRKEIVLPKLFLFQQLPRRLTTDLLVDMDRIYRASVTERHGSLPTTFFDPSVEMISYIE